MKSCVCYNCSYFDVFYYVAENFSCKQRSIYHRINFLSKKAWKSSDKTWKNEEKTWKMPGISSLKNTGHPVFGFLRSGKAFLIFGTKIGASSYKHNVPYQYSGQSHIRKPQNLKQYISKIT